jgi:hypothetical protein
MKLTFTSILFLLAAFCFAQSDTSKASYSNDKIKIEYPKTWRLDTSGIMGTEFFVFSPLENETDKFSENVNGLIQDLSGQNIDLEKYKEITDKQLIELATDGVVFESVVVKTDDRNYFKILYAMTQGKFRLKICSICYIKDDKAYLLFFKRTKQFHQYLFIIKCIFNPFYILVLLVALSCDQQDVFRVCQADSRFYRFPPVSDGDKLSPGGGIQSCLHIL